MYQNRFDADGNPREPDKWKKNCDFTDTYDCLLGHMQDVKLIMEGHKVTENGKERDIIDALCGVAFNIDVLLDLIGKALLEDKPVERLFQDDFNIFYKKK